MGECRHRRAGRTQQETSIELPGFPAAPENPLREVARPNHDVLVIALLLRPVSLARGAMAHRAGLRSIELLAAGNRLRSEWNKLGRHRQRLARPEKLFYFLDQVLPLLLTDFAASLGDFPLQQSGSRQVLH